MKFLFPIRPLPAVLLAGLLVGSVARFAHAEEPAAVYDRILAEYMGDKWDDLESDLKTNVKHLGSLPYAQKQILNYIAQSFVESRPPWWETCKHGKQALIKTGIFGVPIDAVYDPEQKQSTNINVSGNIKEVTLGWPSAEMDNPDPAEHGFTKGELNGYGVWSTLGTTSVYMQMPFQSVIELLNSKNEADKLKLTRIVDFRSNVAAAYYGEPRSRQWAIFLSMHYFQLKYHKAPIVMSRKSLADMVAAEVVAHRAQYPSFHLPDKLDPDNAEETLVTSIHDWIEKHQWTLPEDKLLREAIRAFAVGNEAVLRTGGPIKLANGLAVALDPDEDTPFREKRDQWLVLHLSGKK